MPTKMKGLGQMKTKNGGLHVMSGQSDIFRFLMSSTEGDNLNFQGQTQKSSNYGKISVN